MSKFEAAESIEMSSLKLTADETKTLRQHLLSENPESVLEICREPGQVTLLVASILEDMGQGGLTTFQPRDWDGADHFASAVRELEIAHRVSPILYDRSYSWAIGRLLSAPDRPVFDICILNGNKSWDSTGFGLLLCDMLLRPGGLLVLTDMAWSMAGSKHFQRNPALIDRHESDEFRAKPVQFASDLILPHLGYDSTDITHGSEIAYIRKGPSRGA